MPECAVLVQSHVYVRSGYDTHTPVFRQGCAQQGSYGGTGGATALNSRTNIKYMLGKYINKLALK